MTNEQFDTIKNAYTNILAATENFDDDYADKEKLEDKIWIKLRQVLKREKVTFNTFFRELKLREHKEKQSQRAITCGLKSNV